MSLRIIGGTLRGRRISSIDGSSTRPTPDMVREAIFNVIGNEIRGTSFLELFAGTGAVGIEAISRGAEKAVLVEGSLNACETIKKNIDACTINSRCRVIRWDIERNLNFMGRDNEDFDMVFLDPPYDKDLVGKTLRHLSSCGSLKKEALIVVQHSVQELIEPVSLGECFDLEKEKRYGKTLVSFLRYML